MSNHFTSIGFPIETEDDVHGYAMEAVENGESIRTKHGTYVRWSTKSGAELGAQFDANNEMIGLSPHFSGDAVMRVELEERVARPKDTVLEGGFYARADPSSEKSWGGPFPFVFDCPDYALCGAVKIPTVLDVQLSAFAHEIKAHPTVEEYDAHQSSWRVLLNRWSGLGNWREILGSLRAILSIRLRQGRWLGLASQAFVPAEPPRAYAMFAGHILATALLTNSATGLDFCWAKVHTLGGDVDVVADPAILKGSLVEGGVLNGSFWLSGRLVNDLQAK